VQFTLGFDLSPYSASYLGDKVLPANGQLSADAVFSVGLDGANPTQVTVARKATNTMRTQLVNDINAAFTAAGLVGITASVDGSGKLRFTHLGTLLGARIDIIAPNPNTNTAVTELGLKMSVSASDNLLSRAFLRDVRAGGTVNLNAADIDATANFGFFGVGINNGTAAASAVLDVQVRNPSNTSGPILLSQLFDANNSIATWGVLTRTGTLSATLPIAINGNLFPLPGNPAVTLAMTNVFTPNTLSIQFPDLQPLLNYRNLSLSTLLTGFDQLSTYLTQIEGFSFLGQKLPLINRSVTELVSFVNRFAAAKGGLSSGAPSTIQQVEALLEEAFGIPANALSLQFTDTDVRFNLNLGATIPVSLQNLAMDLDLAKFGPGVANLNGVGNLIDVSGSAKLTVDASANLNLQFGFDVSNPNAPQTYIADGSSLSLTAKIAGSNLNFKTAAGPLGLFIKNGSVSLDNGSGGPASFSVSFKPVAGDKYFFNQWSTSLLNTALTGRAEATLPVFFPLDTVPLGGAGNNNIHLLITNLASPQTTTTLTAPNISFEMSTIDLAADMSGLLQGIDFLLARIQDAMSGNVFGVQLPIVGDSLKDRATFISDLRTQVVQKLQQAFNSGNKAASVVQSVLGDLLGESGLGWLKDVNGDGHKNAGDITATPVNDANGKAQRIDWVVPLGTSIVATAPVGFSLGLPGLGLAASPNSAVQLSLGYDFRLAFGVSRTEGFYFDTSAADELKVSVSASIPHMAVGGTLGFLRLAIRDDDSDPSSLSGTFTVDIKDSNNHLTFNELSGGGLNLSTLFTPKLALTGKANLKLQAGITGDSSDPANSHFFSDLFPTLKADFNLLWTFDTASGTAGTLQKAEFNNVGIDISNLFGSLLGPVLERINATLEPFRPIIKILNEPIPLISDIAGSDITLIDLATAFFVDEGFISPETAKFIQSVSDIVTSVDSLSSVIQGDGFINLGGFDLKTGDLRNPSFVLSNFSLTPDKIKAPGSSIDQQLLSKVPTFKSARDKFQSVDGTSDRGKFMIPLIDNPLNAFQLLLGKDVTLFQYDLPTLGFGFQFDYTFPTPAFVIPTPVGPIPIYVGLTGGFSVAATLGFGYDTQGAREFVKSQNPLDLLDGFFLSDFRDGKDVQELTLTGYLGAFAEANLAVVAVGAEGGVKATIGFDLNDPNNDGKMHGREFLDRLSQGGPLCLFTTEGDLSLYLDLFLKIKLPWPLPDIKLSVPAIPDITLVDFTVSTCGDAPVLATMQSDGTLLLNMGPRSAFRINGDLSDGDETFEVLPLSSNTVMVRAFC
jgi:hypothetical protein